MNFTKTTENNKVVYSIEGRIDTTTAPNLDDELKTVPSTTTELILDFAKVEYISSAGLRVLLSAHKVMSKQGELVITNANEMVMEVFQVTGFTDVLNIK